MKTNQGPILVVEDVPDVLELLEVTLRFKGYPVISAHDGVEALEKVEGFYPILLMPAGGKARQADWLDKVENFPPALIITDILMPRMDGFTFVYNLRLNPQTRNIPVIFLSAQYVTPEDKGFAMSLGATCFIEKPVDTEDFLLTIAEILTRGVPEMPEPLDTRDFYVGYRERLEDKLRHKNAQINRAERLLPSLRGGQRAAFEEMLRQAYSDRNTIQIDLQEVQHALEEIEMVQVTRKN